MRGGSSERARRPREHLCEQLELAAGGGEVDLVGAREVRVEAVEHERFLARDRSGERGDVFGRDAHARHAGVHLQLDRERGAPFARGPREQRHVAGVLDRRRELERGGVVGLRGVVDAAEQQQRHAHRRGAQLRGLGDGGDRETRAARGDEAARHRHRAVAVRVGLHHRDHLAAGGEAHRLAVVVREGGEIDARRGRALALHSPSRSHFARLRLAARADERILSPTFPTSPCRARA